MDGLTNPNDAFNWLKQQEEHAAEAQALNDEAIRKHAQEAEEFAQLVKNVLGTGEGVILMEKLFEFTVCAPLLKTSGTIAESEIGLSPSDWAYVRAGQNSVYDFLNRQIQWANRPRETTKEENQ